MGISSPSKYPQTAVLIPCLNEVLTIGKVVRDFQRELPEATIYVYDNNSSDQTAKIASDSGATVVNVAKRGKGAVVRRMFDEIDAELYVLVDGDDTYPAEAVHQLILPVLVGAAGMSVGDRFSSGAYKQVKNPLFHGVGNKLIATLVARLFHTATIDITSGYRAFSRDFVSGFRPPYDGFELELSMTLHALRHEIPFVEVPIDYRSRDEGSSSKFATFSDGLRLLSVLLRGYRGYT